MRVTHLRIDGHYDASARYVISVLYQFDAEVPPYESTFEIGGTGGVKNRDHAVYDLLLAMMSSSPPIPAP